MEKGNSKRSGLTREETRLALARFNWFAAFRSVAATVCAGSSMYFVAFALSLGVAKEQMGWVAFVISLACVMQLVAIPLANLVSNKKRYVLIFLVVEPLLFIMAVIVGTVVIGMLLPIFNLQELIR